MREPADEIDERHLAHGTWHSRQWSTCPSSRPWDGYLIPGVSYGVVLGVRRIKKVKTESEKLNYLDHPELYRSKQHFDEIVSPASRSKFGLGTLRPSDPAAASRRGGRRAPVRPNNLPAPAPWQFILCTVIFPLRTFETESLFRFSG